MNTRKKIQKEGVCAIVLNLSCPLSCVFCPASPRKISNSMLKEKERRVYKNLQYFKKEGFKRIEIGGSDPTEYDKIIDLIQNIKKEGFEFIQLATNGTKLANSSFLNKLISAGVDNFVIPLYGSNAKIHDSVTQTPGSFNQTTKGIKNILKKKNVKLKVASLLLQQNKHNLLAIVDFVNDLRIRNLQFSIPQLNVDNYSSFYIPLKNLSPYIRKLYNYILRVNNKVVFTEIPFCVFGNFNVQNINNSISLSNLGKYDQDPLPKRVRTSIPNLPSYRLKKKVDICKGCRAFNHCDGFFVNDIDKFGVGKIQKL
jgi:MoaA/NifB/PqqE/SkfB family radical SAM enzyme